MLDFRPLWQVVVVVLVLVEVLLWSVGRKLRLPFRCRLQGRYARVGGIASRVRLLSPLHEVLGGALIEIQCMSQFGRLMLCLAGMLCL